MNKKKLANFLDKYMLLIPGVVIHIILTIIITILYGLNGFIGMTGLLLLLFIIFITVDSIMNWVIRNR